MRYVLLTLALAAAAAQTPPPSGAASGAKLALEAKLYLTREQATQALGIDPGPDVVIVEVKVTPKTEDGKLYLDHDEFLLRSDRDGQRARPLTPTQLAGSSVMVIGSRGAGSGGPVMGGQRRVPYGVPGGVPGADPRGGPPPTMPHPGEGQMGSPTGGVSEATISLEERKAGRQENLLLDALKQKALPEGEITGPVSGLLYFSFEGKHRVKQLELVYSKAPPRVALRFEEPKKK